MQQNLSVCWSKHDWKSGKTILPLMISMSVLVISTNGQDVIENMLAELFHRVAILEHVYLKGIP